METKLKSFFVITKVKMLLPQLLLLSLVVSAQKEFNTWNLGRGVANGGLSIDFNVEPPLIKYSPIDMAESGACICDPVTGATIFFCNHNTIWNSSNQIVSDGTGLKGSNSTTQGSLIIPHPCDCDKYLVFQNDIGEFPPILEDFGLSYSIVDMKQENGLGKVVEKNIPISVFIAEPMIAIKDTSNGYWLVCHKIESYEYVVFHIDNDGVDFDYKTYTTSNYVDDPGRGSLCATFDGKKIAMGQRDNPFVEILDFDIGSGVLEADTTILFDSMSIDHQGAISVAFSPNGKMLYATDFGHLHQFDFTDEKKFKRNIIYRRDTSAFLNAFYFLELAPNGKIYVSLNDSSIYNNYLGVIEFPNESYPDCSFNPTGLQLLQNASVFGLPGIIKSFYSPEYQRLEYEVDFEIEYVDSNKVQFVNRSHNIQSYFWSLGDGAYSNEANPTHIYIGTGKYVVSLEGTNKYGCTKTVEKDLRINFITEVPTVGVYPNPTNNILTVESSRDIQSIELHSAIGQSVLEMKNIGIEKVELNLNGFASQMYIMTIESEGKKIIKEILKIE